MNASSHSDFVPGPVPTPSPAPLPLAPLPLAPEPVPPGSAPSSGPDAPAPVDQAPLAAPVAPAGGLEGMDPIELFAHLFTVFYSVTEVAELLKVARHTVLSWIDAGHLTAFNVRSANTKRPMYRIRAFDLVQFAHRRVVNFPPHLQDKSNDPFAGLVAVWDEELLAMTLVSESEARRIREERDEKLNDAIQEMVRAGF